MSQRLARDQREPTSTLRDRAAFFVPHSARRLEPLRIRLDGDRRVIPGADARKALPKLCDEQALRSVSSGNPVLGRGLSGARCEIR